MKRCKCNPAQMPDEIMTEILLRLPARSVLRFRSVCRAWSSLLRSRSFTDAYAANAEARSRSTNKLVFFTSSGTYCCTQGTAVADRLFTVGRLRTDLLCLSTRPCCGLLLFSDTRSATYWACNPSTGECRRLPQQHRRRPKFSSAGLVLDDRSKECKVVHMFYQGGTDDISCEVYTLSDQNPRWRPATGGKLPLLLQIPAVKAMQIQDSVTKVPPVFADGYLHWVLYPNRNTIVPGPATAAVLCFSVATEIFSIVNAPASEHVAEYRELEEHLPAVPIHLAQLGGSLCMVHDLRHTGHGLDIWVLRDHKTSQWSLDCHVAAAAVAVAVGAPDQLRSPRLVTVIGYSSSDGRCPPGAEEGKRIILATSQHTVHSYSLETGDVKTLLSVSQTAIGSQKEAAASIQLAFYEDSLVRIGPGDDEGQHRDKQVLSAALTMVLLRLPVKSIIQSMLVCKQWCTLIESDSFVQSHMSSMSRPRGVVMVTDGSTRRSIFGFAPIESWLQHTAADTRTIRDKFICSKPCHGLNLISTSSDDYLCNPCTGSILCLGNRGRLHQSSSSWRSSKDSLGNYHAFTVGRSIGLGFDESTGEHVAVEIGHFNGSLSCMVKTGSRDVWSFAGKPPMPVTDMPPARINGTLYWLSEPQAQAGQHGRVIVAFGISARTFSILPCHPPCRNGIEHNNAFLVELNGMLSLVIANKETEELELWMMHKDDGTWTNNAFKICLRKQPNYSLRTEVVVPLQIDDKHKKILLNTGRTLGYYDVETRAIQTLYSADRLQLISHSPMLYEESLVCVQDDELLDYTAPTVSLQEQPAVSNNPNDEGVMGRPCNNTSPSCRPIFHECENSRCQNVAAIYRRCCRRVFCDECADQCLKHSRENHIILPTMWLDVVTNVEDLGLPLDHPLVPGPEYCYYYSTRTADIGRHIFVSVKDYARKKQPCHLTECGYTMEGQVIRQTWVRKYVADDPGH